MTVHRTVTRRVHGHARRVRVNAKKTLPASLQMPTEFLAQNGMAIHRSTPITVTGCAKAKAKKSRKARKHKKKK